MEIAPVTSGVGASAFSSLSKNIDTFLTLLTTQLRNQDPLEPLDTEKFTSQLVQFASVEQSIKTNSNLEALIALQSATERDSALRFVGTMATIDSDQAFNDGNGAKWTYSLPENAASTVLTIVNSAGQTVASMPGAATKGENQLEWDGKTADGRPAADGVYKLIVSARTAEGKPLTTSIHTVARIIGAIFGAEGAQLETASGAIPISAVRRVSAGA
jgi:flagellar basal-body rod modification protein FlgD